MPIITLLNICSDLYFSLRRVKDEPPHKFLTISKTKKFLYADYALDFVSAKFIEAMVERLK